MNANSLIGEARIVHIRELKAQIASLKAELAGAREELAQWRSRFDLVLSAATDAARLGGEGSIVLADGCNLVLGANRENAFSGPFRERRSALVDACRALAREDRFVWIVFDGPKERFAQEGNLRVSFTGGTGSHRADRLILDYLRALKRADAFRGRVFVITRDADFAAEARRLGARTAETVAELQRTDLRTE